MQEIEYPQPRLLFRQSDEGVLEFEQNGLQQRPPGRKASRRQQHGPPLFAEALLEQSADQRFPSSRRSGEDADSLLLSDATDQRLKRFPHRGEWNERLHSRQGREWSAAETKERFVHERSLLGRCHPRLIESERAVPTGESNRPSSSVQSSGSSSSGKERSRDRDRERWVKCDGWGVKE